MEKKAEKWNTCQRCRSTPKRLTLFAGPRKVSRAAVPAPGPRIPVADLYAPAGELLASAGDDGNVIIWVQSETHHPTTSFGSDGLDDKETWRTKHMCRSSGTEIYDLAWSPDSAYFIIGSMDNIARIYNAGSGTWNCSRGRGGYQPRMAAGGDPSQDFLLTRPRYSSSPDRRAQSFCARRSLGPAQRVHRDAIVGPICAHLLAEDQGRTIHPEHARRQAPQAGQPYQGRSATEAHLVQQPCAPRYGPSLRPVWIG